MRIRICLDCDKEFQRPGTPLRCIGCANAWQRATQRVRNHVTKALWRGTLIPKPCEVCGSSKVVAHHDDYSEPLSIRWFCRRHHHDHHVAHPVTRNVRQMSEDRDW